MDLHLRFLDTDDVCRHLGDAGLAVDAGMEGVGSPEEVQTRRGYVLVRRPG